MDEAVQTTGNGGEHVIVLRRGADTPMTEGRDLTWDDFLAQGEGHDSRYVSIEANNPAFILATSGTTANPKLAIHTHGGYQVHVAAMARWRFGCDSAHIDEDGYVWFAGRADEIIKIADDSIRTVEVETAFLMHPAIARSCRAC